MCGTLDYLPPEMGMYTETEHYNYVFSANGASKIVKRELKRISNSKLRLLFALIFVVLDSGECGTRCKCGYLEPWCTVL